MTSPTKLPRGKPFQSKLEPVREIIRDLRRQRKSYREIAQILRAEHCLTVDRTTIWSFVKVRSHPRRVITMSDEPVVTVKRPSVANGRDAIAVLKAQSAPLPKKPLFTFDEDKPLTLKTEKS